MRTQQVPATPRSRHEKQDAPVRSEPARLATPLVLDLRQLKQVAGGLPNKYW